MQKVDHRHRTATAFAVFASLGLAACQPSAQSRPPFPAEQSGRFASFPGRDQTLQFDAEGDLSVIYHQPQDLGGGVAYRRFGAAPLGPIAVSPPGASLVSVEGETSPRLERLPDGSWLAAYTLTLPGKWQTAIATRRSADGGETWGPPRLVHAEEPGLHAFLSSAATSRGVAFAWLDDAAGKMGLRVSSTTDGESFTRAELVDEETCECCGTAMLAGPAGELWLVYRELEDQDLRDFEVLRSAGWPPAFAASTRLSNDGWRVRGCPETGARLALGAGVVVWEPRFTPVGAPGIYFTHSTDGGAGFAPRTRLSGPGKMAHHPEVGILPDGRVVVLYETVDRSGTPSVVARLRSAEGSWDEEQLVAAGASYARWANRGEQAALAVHCGSGGRSELGVVWWSGAGAAGLPQFAPCPAEAGS